MQKPRAILLDVIPPQLDRLQAARRMRELESLTETYGGFVVVRLMQKRSEPHYRTYVGPGKLAEIAKIASADHADLLVLNNQLKPKQLFEIEEFFRARKTKLMVWDRIDLILKIFQKNAKTAEAKLQIKLAAIRHMGPRIFGMGMELMQQTGGTGVRGGQGETNTELMRRHLDEQERRVERGLEKIASSRALHRRRRDRLGLTTVSIVGYTNAGKSSLLNALTRKGALVADALFATLDTRIGKLSDNILLSDTIGFIQDLPPQLIGAFRSTLDETVEADLLLHVIDVSDPFMRDKILEVETVLEELGVAQTPKIYAFNKCDLADGLTRSELAERYAVFSPSFVSAMTGEGLNSLRACITARAGGIV